MFIDLQINYLLWLQELRENTPNLVTDFFLFITGFGEYFLPFSVCAIAYWCANKKLGTLLILNTSAALMLNQFIKSLFCLYRPWMLDNRIVPVTKALRFAGGYSFPSGHSTLAVSCWGSFILWYQKNKKIFYGLGLLCILVAFSRNWLGVHTLQDILIGLLTGIAILIFFYKTLNHIEQKKNGDLILALSISVIGILITLYTYYKNYPLNLVNNTPLIDITRSKLEALPKLGLLLGAFWGWYIDRHWIRFNPTTGTLKTKTLRAGIGLIPLFLLMTQTGHLWHHLCGKGLGGFFYMLTLSLYITVIYPWILTSIKNRHLSQKTNGDK